MSTFHDFSVVRFDHRRECGGQLPKLFVFVRSELPHPSGRSPALGPALAPWPRGISAKVQSLWDLLESQVDALVLKKQDTRAAFWRWFLLIDGKRYLYIYIYLYNTYIYICLIIYKYICVCVCYISYN